MEPFAACPKCAATGATKVGFTWWGGLLGPKLLHHVKCPKCGCQYNGRSGQSNTTGIIIYTVVVCLIAGAAGVALVLAR